MTIAVVSLSGARREQLSSRPELCARFYSAMTVPTIESRRGGAVDYVQDLHLSPEMGIKGRSCRLANHSSAKGFVVNTKHLRLKR